MRRLLLSTSVLALLLLPAASPAPAGRFPLLAMQEGGDGGAYINLIVREIRAAPVRAHVGDQVRIDLIVENRGDGYGTLPIRVYANGREVAGRLYTYGWGNDSNRTTRESFVWNTKGAAPGEYRLRGEVYHSSDASEFDNSLDLAEKVVLVAPGEPIPSGAPEAFTRDPRWKPAPDSAMTTGGETPGGY